MTGFWKFFLKKQAFTYMLMISLTIAGLYSIILIPKESAPEVIIPVGVVSSVLRGGSAEDVEKLITNKLEQEIANVENIDKVTSVSREGVSVVTAQFLANADVERSIQLLKDAVDKAVPELPDDATTPTVTKINFADQPILILSIAQQLGPTALTELGDSLKDELKKVKGVSKVEVSGTRKKEVQVIVRKDKLAQYNLSIGQVIAAVQQSNTAAPIGRITVSDIDYPIQFEGDVKEGSEVNDISLQTANGTVVYLRDIAQISDGVENPRTYSRVSVAGEPSENALTLYVYKKSGGDVTAITASVRERIDELKTDMLNDAQVVITLDAGKEVEKDLRQLTRAGLETVVLVMLVLFLTIGWRESVVAGLSIPLSFVIAFIGLHASGNTINFVSLFSLILAIGILVDSGIVVAEAIHTRYKRLGNVYDAAVASIHEYAWPLIAGTMTTVAVFFPLFFLTGTTGKFIQSIPFTIIFVLFASIFVALGMVPLLATLLAKKDDDKNRFTEWQEELFHASQEWYKRQLGVVLNSRLIQKRFFWGLALSFVGVIALLPLGLIKVELFPQDDQSFVIVSIERQEGTPLAVTDLVVRQVEEILYEEPLVASFVSQVGSGSALLQGGGGSNSKYANITVMLQEDRALTSSEVITVLRKELAHINDAIIRVEQGNNGPPGGKPVLIKFKGESLDELGVAADTAERLLLDIEGTQDVETSLRDDGTRFELTVDRAKASRYGVSPADIAQVLRASVSGIVATTIKKQESDIDVVVKLDLNELYTRPEDTTKTNLDSIKNLPIVTRDGSFLLGSVLTSSIAQSRTSIAHEDQQRIASVSADVTDGVTAVEVVSAFQSRVDELGLPATVTIDYGGETEEVNNTFRDMMLALVAGLALMLAILVLEFNSFRYSFFLLLAVPLSLVGVLGGLAITGLAMSFSAMLGYIALAGVIINHAIILLDSIIHRLDQEKLSPSGAKLFDIIIESSAVRLRPIFLTTVTTVVGMIPLISVSALWGPLAVSIMFGLSFAMILTLVLIPVLFYRYPGKRYAEFR